MDKIDSKLLKLLQQDASRTNAELSLLALLPEQPPLYGEDEITDKSQRFLAGELLREQLMRQLGAELPYATTVEVETFTEEAGKHGLMYRIGAVIWVERDGQKAIVILLRHRLSSCLLQHGADGRS